MSYSVTLQLDSVENHDDLVLQLVKVLSLLENRRILQSNDVLAELDLKGPRKLTRTGLSQRYSLRSELGELSAKLKLGKVKNG